MFPHVSPARDASRNMKMDVYNLVDTLKRCELLNIFSDASRAGELLVPKSGPKSALNPESAQNLYKYIIL